ncbi:prepilin-type N-terminal cleavage/methylation domain-containing protein [Arenimonas composti]|uniref:Type II secretion system protein J n=1 Tax=Arenimonas composti TR7-09 = DSM 18010 TaxID=1121013 RepID=A0A091BHU7_9GAMM|nr:prepilin-type N-terminal cleavage/methylation domain-containing protein [Arenimonas composti]KFN51326.1 hypothetical protein P873_03400 [Arenimonas composti TR7-09 = DSM 18010]
MKRARGFTLVEMMLVVTLLAAALALGFATLRNATQATERAEETAQRQERLRAVQGFLRRQLAAAMPLPMAPVDADDAPEVFLAAGDELSFVAPMPGYLSRGGPYLQTFRLVPDRGGLRLEFEHRLLTLDGPAEPEREPEVLLDGIAEGRFETRRFDERGNAGGWTSRWKNPDEIPRLVRLRLRMQDGAGDWPTLVVAPRLGQNAPPVASGDTPGVPREDEE